MAKTTETFKQELSRLSAPERAELAHFLLDSLDEEVEEDVQEAWDEEITRRLAEIEGGTAKGEPSDRVIAELREKYSVNFR